MIVEIIGFQNPIRKNDYTIPLSIELFKLLYLILEPDFILGHESTKLGIIFKKIILRLFSFYPNLSGFVVYDLKIRSIVIGIFYIYDLSEVFLQVFLLEFRSKRSGGHPVEIHDLERLIDCEPEKIRESFVTFVHYESLELGILTNDFIIR